MVGPASLYEDDIERLQDLEQRSSAVSDDVGLIRLRGFHAIEKMLRDGSIAEIDGVLDLTS